MMLPLDKTPGRRLRRLFNVSFVPGIPFGWKELPDQVRRSVGNMSISGVQRKASVVLNKKEQILEIALENGTHILKPDLPAYPQIAIVENLSMDMAEMLEMEVPPHAVLPMADETPAYVIKRFDRLPKERRIHKEDMAQLLGVPTDFKYDGSLEKVGKAIRTHATNIFLDLINYYERVLFSFLIGNSDMHLKNWALVDTGTVVKLAPCYDLVASTLYIQSEEESALAINEKRNNLTRGDFDKLAGTLELDPKSVRNIYAKFRQEIPNMRLLIEKADLSAGRKADWKMIIEERARRLFG